MATIVGIRFKNAGKLYYFSPESHWPKVGEWVVVETARGQELGEVVVGVREVGEDALVGPLKPVIRIATDEDMRHQEKNESRQVEAFDICQEKILAHKLDMKLVRVEYTFDNSKILFYFTANGRVDFRNLVKELASIFKTRIELRQIGVRDEAKMIGGLGPCGRPICCDSFLSNFQPVSIKMAKEQNLSLNPIKISGVCGRLMCCLQYEQEGYEKARKKMPKPGKEVLAPEGNGIVWDINVLKETVKVKITEGDTSEIKEYPLKEIKKLSGESYDPDVLEEETEVSFPKDINEEIEEALQAFVKNVPEEKNDAPQKESFLAEQEEKQPFVEKKMKINKGQGKRKIVSAPKNGNEKGERRKASIQVENRKPVGKMSGKNTKKPFIADEKPSKKTEEKHMDTPSAISPWQKAVEEALEKAKENKS
ncbi:MAG: stage 0 sporulation family protein [Clostridiales bacterium]|nr:stage 0 sporulation family protein [Clostridiales bacterium]